MTQATLGFIFNTDLSKVLLITKNRPASQKGKVNGVGGKTEADELAETCVSREVWEETGLKIDLNSWKTVGSLHFDTWDVSIFAAIFTGDEEEAKSKTDETVDWYRVDDLPHTIMSNLSWLIPLSLDVLTSEPAPKVTIHYG